MNQVDLEEALLASAGLRLVLAWRLDRARARNVEVAAAARARQDWVRRAEQTLEASGTSLRGLLDRFPGHAVVDVEIQRQLDRDLVRDPRRRSYPVLRTDDDPVLHDHPDQEEDEEDEE